MDFSDIHILRLEEDERVETFDCGDEDLNDFIINEAQPYRKALIATSYVAQNSQGALLGFFSLASANWLTVSTSAHTCWISSKAIL